MNKTAFISLAFFCTLTASAQFGAWGPQSNFGK
jgi:hypothetical protein